MIALTRDVPATLASCELTHLARTAIDLDRARAQHAEYERLLAAAGCRVQPIAPARDHPDSAFVEDTAVVLDELAIITRPGAASRRGETAAVAETLGAYRQLQWLAAPATLDGGDVLVLGRTLYVGVGGRTNEDGASQLLAAVRAFGYEVHPVRVDGCLHLKSAATAIAPGIVLVNPAWVDGRIFAGYDRIEIDPAEPFAANVLRIDGRLLCAAAHPLTADRLRRAGLDVWLVDVSELAKAEAGLTCCSLIFEERR